MNTVPVNVSYV